jgi:hypothetical protein
LINWLFVNQLVNILYMQSFNDMKDNRARTNRKTKKDYRTGNTFRKKPHPITKATITTYRDNCDIYNSVSYTEIDVLFSKYICQERSYRNCVTNEIGITNEIGDNVLYKIIKKLEKLSISSDTHTVLDEGEIITVTNYQVPASSKYLDEIKPDEDNHVIYTVSIPDKPISKSGSSILSKDNGYKKVDKYGLGRGPCRGVYVYNKRQESRSREHMINEEQKN